MVGCWSIVFKSLKSSPLQAQMHPAGSSHCRRSSAPGGVGCQSPLILEAVFVRFIGTDQHLTVKQFCTKSRQFQVQRDNDETIREWVLGIYLELVKPSRAEAIDGVNPTLMLPAAK